MGRTASFAFDGQATRPRIAYVVRSFPRLSQTHILNEIRRLEQLGHEIQIFGMVPSGEKVVQKELADVKSSTEFLDDSLRRPLTVVARNHFDVFRHHPIRYAGTAWYLLRRRNLTAGYTTTTRLACFKQAVYLAGRLQDGDAEDGGGVDHVHSHFAHDPTLIALLVSRLTGIPFSFTAHARDMYQIPRSSLAQRIEQSSAVVTICQANIDYMKQVVPEAKDKFRLIHTGIDTHAFRPSIRARQPGGPPLIVSVSRLVAKKGLLDLLGALKVVKTHGRRFRCVIYGDGPMHEELVSGISELGLEDEVELAGATTLAKLRGVLPLADIFALTPFVTNDGDREGIPSSILEAMACGLAVVTTPVGGISEAVDDGVTGLVAEPHDVDGIARRIESLLDDDTFRLRLGANAREAIVRELGAEVVASQLAAVFGAARPAS
jgi:glycosyltransferase involved in cell wall biosynthesis